MPSARLSRSGTARSGNYGPSCSRASVSAAIRKTNEVSLDPNQGPGPGARRHFRTVIHFRSTDRRSQIMKAVSAEEAVAMIPNGATIMVGGFMGVGTPERLLDELVRRKKS